MKKLIVITLLIVLVLGLCACSQNDETQNTTNNTNNQTQNNQTEDTTTTQAPPSDTELDVLAAYQALIEELYNKSAEGIISSNSVKEYYDKLMAMDLSVVRKFGNSKYIVADIEWDCDAVLDSFVIHKDVLLGHNEKYSWRNDEILNLFIHYDEHGNSDVRRFMTTWFMGNTISFSVTDGRYSFIETNPMDLPGCPYPIFDANGRVEKIEWRSGKSFVKNKDNASLIAVSSLSYNADGKIAQEVVAIKADTTTAKQTDNTGCTYTITYTYADNGQLTEIYAANDTIPGLGEYRWKYEYNANGLLIKSEVYTYHDCSEAATQQTITAVYTDYTYQADGSMIAMHDFWEKSSGRDWFQVYTKEMRCTFAEDGRISTIGETDKSGENLHTLVYGDYYIFNPNN